MSAMPHGSLHATVPEFIDEVLYDPFMAEAMSEEKLAHIHSQNHTPNPQSAFVPPSSSSSSMSTGEMDQSHAQHADASRLHDSSEPFFGRIDSGLSTNSLGFRFDPDTTPLPFGDGTFDEENIVAAEQLDTPVDPPSRKSSGLATVSGDSHLMSPTLTNDTGEPASPTITKAHNLPYKLLGGGDMSRDSSLSTTITSFPPIHFLHTTPAPTRSSADTSPDPNADMRFPSPLVRVVDLAQGEEQSRVIHSPSTKRGRGQLQSGLLHPGHAHPGYDEDDEEQEEEEQYGHRMTNGLNVGGGQIPPSRTGVAPGGRGSGDAVPSINEQAETRKRDERNDQVASWLLNRDDGPGTYLDPNAAIKGVRGRLRSKSQSKNSQQLRADAFRSSRGRREAQDRFTPGPDVLIDEDSGESDDDDATGSYQESAPASVDGRHDIEVQQESDAPFGRLDLSEGIQQARYWSDPFHIPSFSGDRTQPATANAAMMRFQMRNRDLETASRAATWGTRRMSDSTLDQVFGSRGLFSKLKLTNSREKEDDDSYHEIRSSLQEGIDSMKQRYRAFRSNSVNRRKSGEPFKPPQRTDTYMRGVSPHERPEPTSPSHDRKQSNGSFTNMIHRIPSTRRSTHSRPSTPHVDTGRETPRPPAIDTTRQNEPGPSSPSSGGGFKESFRRLREGLSRHRSDDSHSSSDALAAMLHKNGGPPVAAITSPRPEKQTNSRAQAQAQAQTRLEERMKVDSDEGDDHDDAATVRPEEKSEKGIKMPMAPQKDLIIPNFDGFKTNVRDVNPRLEQWLVERLGQEQLRRYKRLVELKVQHHRAVATGTCQSGDFCVAKGGQPRYFAPPKSQSKEVANAGEAEVPLDDMDEDEQAIAEGTVTEAQFPLGLPMPPVQRLPAEFECPFCFTVKKFTKPSDWSKHVHEDLQPFTCTFKNCSDPKSFKRKADWVRHENERHRQLEWWECTEEGCQHRCYRRDNFVQHLIREHKLPEPSTKPAKQPNKPAVRGPAKGKGRGRGNTTNINDVPPEEKVMLMVEICRHETKKSAVEERCRFCNNVCNSWKKLTVHLARHMEQLSIPVLDLVKIREVSVDTIISPLEPRPPMQASVSPVEQQHSGSALTSPHPFGATAPVAGGMSLAANMMDPSAFTPLQDPSYVGGQYDTSAWTQWATSQAATQLSYGTSPAGVYGGMSQTPYGDGAAADATGVAYLSQAGGRGMYIPDGTAPQQGLYEQQAIAVSMGNRNGFGQQVQPQQYAQPSQWPELQYNHASGQSVGYAEAAPVGAQQQRQQQQQQQQQVQNQQSYYGSQWQS